MAESHSVSLEISTNSLRLIDISKIGDQFLVHGCTYIEFANPSKNKIQEALKQVLHSGLAQGKLVSTSVWSSSVIVRPISLPIMTAGELKGAIRFEAEKHLPFSIDDCILDYFVMKKVSTNRQMEVMLVAAKKELIEERRKMVEEGGFSLKFVDIHPFAVSNAFSLFHSTEKGKSIAFIHIGDMINNCFAGSNFVNILKDGVPVVVRDLGQDNVPGKESVSLESINSLVENIKSSIAFYENSNEEVVDNVYISGQGASEEKINERLSEVLEKKIEKWGFASKVKFASEEPKKVLEKNESDFTICMGLAARSFKS